MSDPLLLIDSDGPYIQALGEHLVRFNYDVYTATNKAEVLQAVDEHSPKYIVGHPNIEDTDGIDLFIQIKAQLPDTPLIVIAREKRLDNIMRKMGLKAFSYLRKPVSSTELNLTLQRAREWRKQQEKINVYVDQLGTLHQSTLLFRQLFDAIPCYISVQNKQYRITAANRLFKQHFGDAVGEYCYRIYKHRRSPCRECPVAETFEDGQFHSTEEIVTSKDGKQYNVITWTAPIEDDDKNIVQVIEMSTNITQIRELQNHLESLGMMIGSMSHGVKGMLTALDGGIYQLETGIKKNDETRINKALIVTKDTFERIKKMVLNILYYAKSRELNAQEMDIKIFSETIVNTLSPLAKNNHVTLIATIPDDLGTFFIDTHWFHAAVINIVENSIDACSSGNPEANFQVEFNVSLKNKQINKQMIVFEIRDNGMGMDQETREKIFTLFFSSKGSKGTGLGLFIANHVVKEHGGNITVESESGKGSVFTIQVPRTPPKAQDEKGIYMIDRV